MSKVFKNISKEQTQVRANQKPFLVAEEDPGRLKQNTKNTNKILNCEDVCHSQCQNSADHKHEIQD